MKTKETIKQILALGWEVDTAFDMVSGVTDNYRGSQGGFKTLWRPTPEQVLKDVQAIVEARNTANRILPF